VFHVAVCRAKCPLLFPRRRLSRTYRLGYLSHSPTMKFTILTVVKGLRTWANHSRPGPGHLRCWVIPGLLQLQRLLLCCPFKGCHLQDVRFFSCSTRAIASALACFSAWTSSLLQQGGLRSTNPRWAVVLDARVTLSAMVGWG
jgi:hypothetical protein